MNKNQEKNLDKLMGKMVKVFNFNKAIEPPTYGYNKGLSIVNWGKNNDYPKELLNYYNNNGSSKHKSIINKKIKLIAGNGFKEVTDERLQSIIVNNKLWEHVKRATLDYELYNGFALEVIWSNDRKTITNIQHIPFHKLRMAIDDDGEVDFNNVWYSNNWKEHRKPENEPRLIKTFNSEKPGGKQIYYFCEYNPETDGLYPIPSYSTGLNWIDLHYRISTFHLSQARNGYAPSFLLNFATGIPSEEEQDEFFKEFKRNFGGEENAGKIIITYSDGQDGIPTFIKVDLNDSDERFIMLSEQIGEEIVTAHEVPAPLMILTPGKLSSTDEREELLKEFQYSYIDQRQQTIEDVLFEIISTVGIEEELKLKTYVDARVQAVDTTETDEETDNAEASDNLTE
jgi:hypothetical protein